jgi:hypothetical protein
MNNGSAYHPTKPRQPTAKAQATYDMIHTHPGISTAQLSKLLACANMPARLASLEAQGLLISEDEYGCLYPFP